MIKELKADKLRKDVVLKRRQEEVHISIHVPCVIVTNLKHSSCKKECGPMQGGQGKKLFGNKYMYSSCDGRSVAEIFIATIQVNLCCLIPASLVIGTEFT